MGYCISNTIIIHIFFKKSSALLKFLEIIFCRLPLPFTTLRSLCLLKTGSWKAKNPSTRLGFWCRKRGSNPHGIATTGFWVQHVCQFHHSGVYFVDFSILSHLKQKIKSFWKIIYLCRKNFKTPLPRLDTRPSLHYNDSAFPINILLFWDQTVNTRFPRR